MGKLKFSDINGLINSIKGNTKKKLNELNEIKKAETNGKEITKFV